MFGLLVSAVDYDQAVGCILQAAKNHEAAIVSCHAVHAVVTLSSDSELREQANRFAMITPDGQPVRWALNSLYRTDLHDRVYGPELMWRVLRECEANEVSVYLYGGSERTLAKLHTNVQDAFPQLKIAGCKSPPYRELTKDELINIADEINGSGAEIVFIGLGCPKQDKFAASQATRIRGIQICVGAAFDFHAKVKPTAPAWMQRYGLEWAFRLACEPRRLFNRYLTTNSIFVYRFVQAIFGKAWNQS
ncbi:WecB/TagA/CpsF family glycosyltransferase [Neorhodopirellula pilleata]|uniref:WecB/TagA/CpsF family glycosyltransferase n=1 Tax=Neorhodopirellula pilleata TaxID=2714738 RepID=UPI0011B3CFF0|nr:WecB/TagA/CpsF family glycosyltransferase [Neorhodopirellula pilleata]